jgi:hypothetical protein
MALAAAVAIVSTSLLRVSTAQPARPASPDQKIDIAYFRSLLDNGGPKAILDKLYVAPPFIFQPLMTGIESGTSDWLDLYDKLWVAAKQTGALGTMAQLDDAVARGLGSNAVQILRHARTHEAMPLEEICARTAPLSDDPADVLDARETLGVARRQRGIESINDPDLDALRDKCLRPLRAIVRRQLRIYLASYGAPDAAVGTAPPLTQAEQRELQSEIGVARKRGAISARLDGALPDGPFRVREVPAGALAVCADGDKIANPEGPWNFSDELTGLPHVRLLSACKIDDHTWLLSCEQGGLSTRHLFGRATRANRRWAFKELSPPSRQLSSTVSAPDYWPDCRTPVHPARPR